MFFLSDEFFIIFLCYVLSMNYPLIKNQSNHPTIFHLKWRERDIYIYIYIKVQKSTN